MTSSSTKKSNDNSHFVWEFFILFGIYILAFATRLFSVLRYESIIHEFDPNFNARVTRYLVNEGFYEFHNWFDDRSWFPLGRFIGGTIYPGLMWTAALVFKIANMLHFTVNIRNVCVLLAPWMASNTSVAVYLLTKEIWSGQAGVIAAMFISIVPGYISRSVAGSYDNEAVAIFAMTITFYFWCKAVNTGSMFWAACSAICYFYMVAGWGGYIFLINIIPVHVFVLILAGRYSHRLYVSYTTFFILGLIMSMNISFVSFIPVSAPEHLASIGVFGLLQVYTAFEYIRGLVSAKNAKPLLWFFVMFILSALGVLIALSLLGYIPFLTGRLLQLLGSTKNIAIVKSVSEHQPSPWTTFFFDFSVLHFLAPVGMYYGFKKLNDGTAFIILYVMFASYFAGIMVRLVLVLAPALCVLGGIGVSETLMTHMGIIASVDNLGLINGEKTTKKNKETPATENEAPSASEVSESETDASDATTTTTTTTKQRGKKFQREVQKKIRKRKEKQLAEKATTVSKLTSIVKDDIKLSDSGVWKLTSLAIVLTLFLMAFLYVIHCTWVTSIAYSSPSVVLQARNHDGSVTIFDDFREAYYWLAQNTADNAKILSWWDYGYQITEMGNRTVIVDNNTRNNTHIATVGLAMASTEEDAYPILKNLDVDYVLVVFGGMIGYSSDDINKFLWMVRISGGIYPRIVESDYFSASGEYRMDYAASKTMRNSLMYKMCYYRFGELQTQWGQPTGFDRVRNCEIGEKNIKLTRLEEAFTSEHWMVRIYRVKREVDNVGGAMYPKVKYNTKPRPNLKTLRKKRRQRLREARQRYKQQL